jgi:hypothetical protein
MSGLPTFPKNELKAMDKKELVKLVLSLYESIEKSEVQGLSERATLMRMASHFLGNMKRPNTSRTAKKGKRPAKFLKWFNAEER